MNFPLKYKIIAVIFAVILLFYAGFFVAKTTQTPKTSEHFEEKKEKKEVDVDAIKIDILKDIDKLSISDSTIRGKLMEFMLSTDTVKSITDMTAEKRMEFIKTKYMTMNPEEKIAPPKSLKDIVKSQPTEPEEPETFAKDSDYTMLSKSTSTIIGKLNDVTNDVNNLQKKLQESFIADPKVPAVPSKSESFIEGFENLRYNTFASFQ